MRRTNLLNAVVLGLMLTTAAACRPRSAPAEPTPTPTPRPTATPIPTSGPPTAAITPTPAPLGPYGPTGLPANVNPLTGLPIPGDEDEVREVLERRPVYVKISNHPPEYVVPQSGLSFADHVWEHQVEGFALTRLSAVYLTQGAEMVGPIRSGRMPDFELVPMYQAIYVASGFSTNGGNPDQPPRVRELMLRADWRPRNFSYEFGVAAPATRRFPLDGIPTEHTLFTIPDELWNLADEREVNGKSNLEGMAWATAVPEGGTATQEAVIDYPGVGPKATWRYDDSTEKWLRWMADEPHTDKLTEEQLAFDNVVIVRALHYETDFPEDFITQLPGVAVDLYGQGEATVLRDGQRWDVTWFRQDSQSEKMLQFIDDQGFPFYFKPGQTWFQMVSIGFGGPVVCFDAACPALTPTPG